MAQNASFDNLNTIKDSAKEKVQNVMDQPIREGRFTRRIEEQTAKLPSVGYLGLAIGSMAISAVLVTVARRKELANFVGLWAPSFLLMGIYNKLVKLEGFDSENRLHDQQRQAG